MVDSITIRVNGIAEKAKEAINKRRGKEISEPATYEKQIQGTGQAVVRS